MPYNRVIACILILVLCACGGGKQAPYPGTKVGKPYEINGRWYRPGYDKDYDEVGVASWYGPGFNGGRTASGERFNENAITAAHRTLPLPCIVRVTNLDNGLSAIIKVNDRGPFAHSRIIDLSRGAAIKLGVIRTGTAKVRVQFLDQETRDYVSNLRNGTQYAMNEISKVNPDEAGQREEEAMKNPLPDDNAPGIQMAQAEEDSLPRTVNPEPIAEAPEGANLLDEFSVVDETLAPPAVMPTHMAMHNANIFVQAGTFGIKQNALNLIDRISDRDTPQIMQFVAHGKTFYRVMIGPFAQDEEAKNILSKLQALGISDARIIHQ